MMDTAAVSSILDELYHSTLDPERLPNALSRLGSAFGCEHVALIDRNIETFEARLVTTGFDAASQREFIDVWSHHDIVRLRTRHWRVGAIETDRHIVPRQEYVASDYYNGFLKPRDVHAQMRMTLGYEGKFRRIMTLVRPRSAGDFDDEAIAPCRLLMPHLQRVSQMVFRADGLHAMLGALSDVADRSVAGILLVGSGGKIKFANRAAQAVAEAGDAILLRGGQLRVHDRTDDAALQRLIAGATGALREADAARGGVVRLVRQSGKAPYIVTVAPVARGMSPAGTEPMALVLIADPDAAPKPPHETLKQLFGFSAAEIRVAERLMMGESPDRAAAFLDLKVGTARWHLASMFRKTGTKRQAELVRLLLSLTMT